MSDKTLPLVTIITVVFNNVKTLEQTILSVVNQSYSNIEYIIIDGGSTDGSVEIIKKYEKFLSYWVSEKDDGLYFAMNKAIQKSTGELISILNSDDWYEENTLEIVIQHYLSSPQTDVFHGLLRFIDINDNPELISGHYDCFLATGMIEHPTCFIRAEIYKKIGVFDTQYQSAADYDWMQRVKNSGAVFRLIPSVFCNFRRGGISDSLLGALEEIKIRKKYGYLKFSSYWYARIYIFILGIISGRK